MCVRACMQGYAKVWRSRCDEAGMLVSCALCSRCGAGHIVNSAEFISSEIDGMDAPCGSLGCK